MIRSFFEPHQLRPLTNYFLFLVVFVVAVFLRFYNLAISPYYEWDEPVYASIGATVEMTGVVNVKTEVSSDTPYYLYHPPFHFLLLGQWFERFGASIEMARILAAIMSTFSLVILFFFLMTYDGGRSEGALFALFLLGMDGWMVFSNRVGWIENTMMPIGIMGLWLYHSAIKTDSPQYWRYLSAGLVLSFAAIYKHVGIYFLLTVAICWLLSGRRQSKGHVVLAVAAATVIILYVGAMVLTYGDHFIQQYWVQIRRTFGLQVSRGVVETFEQVISAVTGNYRAYAGMMATTTIAIALLLRSVYIAVTHKTVDHLQENLLLFSCSWAAIFFFGSISLKIPHYYIMLLVPLYAYAAIEVTRLVREHPKWIQLAVGLTAAIFIANIYTFIHLFAVPQRNAGAELERYFSEHEPPDTIVIAEETTGTLIKQPYLKLGSFRSHLNRTTFEKYQPTILVTYESITQKPPDYPELRILIGSSEVVRQFKDFKSTLTVYRIPKSVWKNGTIAAMHPQ